MDLHSRIIWLRRPLEKKVSNILQDHKSHDPLTRLRNSTFCKHSERIETPGKQHLPCLEQWKQNKTNNHLYMQRYPKLVHFSAKPHSVCAQTASKGPSQWIQPLFNFFASTALAISAKLPLKYPFTTFVKATT